jgi:hypothetical protein
MKTNSQINLPYYKVPMNFFFSTCYPRFAAHNESQLIDNPLTPELNPSTQRCLTKVFTWDFTS